MSRSSRWYTLAILLTICLSASLLVACGRRSRTDEAKVEDTPAQAATPAKTATATVEFRVEMPETSSPAADAEAGPSVTPGPTKTPWPTQAPTSAPVDDPGMVYVPGGEFTFGSDDGREDESPQQTMVVNGFNIDIHPVTAGDYAAFVEATGQRAPRTWQDGQIPAGKENHPVVWVSWNDAVAYCAWADKRLPTEAEWEKAARGTDGRAYPWGDTFDGGQCNSREGNLGDTSPVGQYADGASPYGVQDQAGNVWEWTGDWYDAHRGSVYQVERFGETYHVMRGGSWFDGADAVRSTSRNSGKPDFYFSTIGFRFAK